MPYRITVIQAYFRMKPTSVSTPFLTSALGFKTHVQCIISVFRGGECIGLGEQSQKSFGRRLQIGDVKVHGKFDGVGLALQAQSTQRDRVSGGSRCSYARSCRADVGMLEASTLAGEILLTPRCARLKSYNCSGGASRRPPRSSPAGKFHLRGSSSSRPEDCRSNLHWGRAASLPVARAGEG